MRKTNATAPASPVNRIAEPQPQPQPQPPAELLDRVLEATAAAKRYSLPEVQFMAKAAAASKLFDNMTEAQAFCLMMISEAEGMHPIEAMRRYHVIHGKPSKKAEAILAEMMARGWDVKFRTHCRDFDRQVAFFKHPIKRPEGEEIEFTMEDAERASLPASNPNWKKYPANMLRSRVVANAARMLDPAVVVGIYSDEEVASMEPADSRPDFPALSDPAPSAAIAPPQSSQIDLKDYLTETVRAYNETWQSHAQAEGIELDAKTREIANLFSTVNAVCTALIEDGRWEREATETNKARDKRKVWDALKAFWINDPDIVSSYVIYYLRQRIEESCATANIPSPFAESEPIAEGSPDPKSGAADDDDEWPPDRE